MQWEGVCSSEGCTLFSMWVCDVVARDAEQRTSASVCSQSETEFIGPGGDIVPLHALPADAIVVSLAEAQGAGVLPLPPSVQAAPAAAPQLPAASTSSQPEGGAFAFHRRKSIAASSAPAQQNAAEGERTDSWELDMGDSALAHVEDLVQSAPAEPPSPPPPSIPPPSGTKPEDPSPPPPPEVDVIAMEGAMLQGLVFAILSATGHAMSILDMAGALRRKTSLPWATHWAPRHGHLLVFLSGLAVAPPPPGFSPLTVLGSKYVNLAGLPGPSLDTSSRGGLVLLPRSGQDAEATSSRHLLPPPPPPLPRSPPSPSRACPPAR